MLGPNLPVAGGGYLRILPYWYTRFGIRRATAEGLPIIAYFHPWELDPEQPRLPARKKSRFRHYTNIGRMAGRVIRLCESVDFQPFREALRTTERPFPAKSL